MKCTSDYDNITYEKKFSALVDSYEQEIADAEHRISLKYANRFLAYYRKQIAKHKLHNHKLQIFAGMGTHGVLLNGKVFYGYNRDSELDKLISSIENSMDWNWSYHLDNQQLNLDYIKKFPQDF